MKKILRFVLPIVIIVGAIAVTKVHHKAKTQTLAAPLAGHSGVGLQVSRSSSKMFADDAAADLQLAAPPDRSATSSGLSPQQAEPNYCTAAETPIVGGCISR